MKDHKDHFLVAQLIKPTTMSKRRKVTNIASHNVSNVILCLVQEPIISSLFTNSRETFQFECVNQHWQFNNLRFAK